MKLPRIILTGHILLLLTMVAVNVVWWEHDLRKPVTVLFFGLFSLLLSIEGVITGEVSARLLTVKKNESSKMFISLCVFYLAMFIFCACYFTKKVYF